MKKIDRLMSMRGRRVLITGATGKLGQTISETIAELGGDMILIDKPNSKFDKLEKKISKYNVKIKKLFCDLENEDDRNSIIQEIKKEKKGLNCLINNAALIGSSYDRGWNVSFEKQSLDLWRSAIEVNLTSIFHLAQEFSLDLRRSKGGNIINITSIYGELGPDWSLYEKTNMGNPAAYSVSKGGLIQLTRWLSTTMAPKVRVNAISPGGILRDQPKKFVDKYERRTPMKRMAKEEDFQGAIAYLASDLSKYVTGQIIRVDGGWGEW